MSIILAMEIIIDKEMFQYHITHGWSTENCAWTVSPSFLSQQGPRQMSVLTL